MLQSSPHSNLTWFHLLLFKFTNPIVEFGSNSNCEFYVVHFVQQANIFLHSQAIAFCFRKQVALHKLFTSELNHSNVMLPLRMNLLLRICRASRPLFTCQKTKSEICILNYTLSDSTRKRLERDGEKFVCVCMWKMRKLRQQNFPFLMFTSSLWAMNTLMLPIQSTHRADGNFPSCLPSNYARWENLKSHFHSECRAGKKGKNG